MGVCKVIYKNNTLVDLTGDTVTAQDLRQGVTAHDSQGQQITGSMPDMSGTSGSIDTVSGAFAIPQGYHDGTGSVAISQSEQAKIIPENIKAGVEILDVIGSHADGVDLSNDTVTADKLLSGTTAHNSNGELITGTAFGAALQPYIADFNCGYIDSGTWRYENPTQTYIDIYEVVSDHRYFLTLGADVGSRFRAIFTTTDISQATQDVTGTRILNTSDPNAYANVLYTASADGYMVIAKDNVGKTGIKTYLYDTTAEWL